MGLYDINFTTLSNALNVPRLRKTKIVSFLNVLSNQLTNRRSKYFDYYVGGALPATFNIGAVYILGNKVIYGFRLYECVAPVQVVGEYPDTSVNFILMQNDFAGADERLKYTNQKVMLEYILNRYFNMATTLPKIYINNNFTVNFSGWLYKDDTLTMQVKKASSNSAYLLSGDYALPATQNDFTIHISAPLYAAISPTPATANLIIRNLVDKYNIVSVRYNIQSP